VTRFGKEFTQSRHSQYIIGPVGRRKSPPHFFRNIVYLSKLAANSWFLADAFSQSEGDLAPSPRVKVYPRLGRDEEVPPYSLVIPADPDEHNAYGSATAREFPTQRAAHPQVILDGLLPGPLPVLLFRMDLCCSLRDCPDSGSVLLA
jgi:hypothetical protein